MIEIEAEPGTTVSHAAQKLVDCVTQTGQDAFVIFNAICLAANKYSTVQSLCAEYDRLCEVRRKEYEASAEGKEAKRKAESERQALQAGADRLMDDLPHLDFANVGNLLHWLCAIEPARDRIGVTVDVEKIRQAFSRHGYEPNMCCGDDFDENSREIHAKWIIGQALAPMYVPLVRHFTEQWVAKF